MTNAAATAEKAFLQFTSCPGEGMQLEILAGDSEGAFLPERPDALARIVADDNEIRWFEFFTPDGRIRLPLSEIERAIAAGKPDVHGEAWYEKHHSSA